jgi:small nuclear ribonucleoprotein (snRNP)-like protein|tara:strand:+ start:1279 stop:1758 length:480 start_codon:yes stop_codon:yes gene_type:complete|mmetsp:Transcript_10913/g.47218  ORF Transcript_10913/g.47218 Transcript_10913/m.47218 type:complete len:160 (-) Transcript_10913:2274-2753(-)
MAGTTAEDEDRDRRPRKSPFQKLRREQRSLLCFVQALVGHLVVIETRDDVTTRGTLVEVDERMNCTLEGAQRVTVEQALEKKNSKFDRMFVRARLIRYVHVPARVDPAELIERRRQEEFDASRHYQAKVVFGPINPSPYDTSEEAQKIRAERAKGYAKH